MPGKQITLLDDRQWPSAGFKFRLPLHLETTALGIIDVQRYAVEPVGHLAGSIQAHHRQLFLDYGKRLGFMVRNIQRLLEVFRGGNRRVFYTRHGIQLRDSSDLILRRRVREAASREDGNSGTGHMAFRGEAAYEIIPEVAPKPGELVLDKNTSSAFHSTPIDLFLRNMEIQTLVLAGIASDQCVLATAIDAADRGFHVIIAHDACANIDPGSAEAAQVLFGRIWGYVIDTKRIRSWLTTGKMPKQTQLLARSAKTPNH